MPFPADSKIAFVNMQALLSESKLGKAGLTQMKALTDKQQADLNDKNKAIQALQQKIQTQSTVVTPETRNQWNSDLEKAQRDLQVLAERSAGPGRGAQPASPRRLSGEGPADHRGAGQGEGAVRHLRRR